MNREDVDLVGPAVAIPGDVGVGGDDSERTSAIGAGDASPGEANAGEDGDEDADSVDAEDDVGEGADTGGHDEARRLGRNSSRMDIRMALVADAREERWEDKYRALLAFRREHGHCHATQSHVVLGHWVRNQRKSYQMGRLSERRRARLAEIGFAWRREDARWEERFAELAARGQRAGDRRDPPHSSALGKWMKKQRERHNVAGDLSEDRVERLEGIGFEWRPASEDVGARAPGEGEEGEGSEEDVARGGGRGKTKSATHKPTKREPGDSRAATRAAIEDLSSQTAGMKEALTSKLQTPKAPPLSTNWKSRYNVCVLQRDSFERENFKLQADLKKKETTIDVLGACLAEARKEIEELKEKLGA